MRGQVVPQTDEERKAKKAARSRLYYAKHRDVILAKNRAYRDADPERERARCKAYRDANVEKERARHALYREENHEALLASGREYYEANKGSVNASHKAHYQDNTDDYRERHKRWHDAHADEQNEKAKLYYADNKERFAANGKRWRESNRASTRAIAARRRARELNSRGASFTTTEHIAGRWLMWGNRCWICGAPATASDHVIPLILGGTHWPANIRPSCTHCNCSKGSKPPIMIKVQ